MRESWRLGAFTPGARLPHSTLLSLSAGLNVKRLATLPPDLECWFGRSSTPPRKSCSRLGPSRSGLKLSQRSARSGGLAVAVIPLPHDALLL